MAYPWRAHRSRGALLAVAWLVAGAAGAHAQSADRTRVGLAAEALFSDETRTRDIRIYGLWLGVERRLGLGFRAGGALGLVVTQGDRSRFNPNQADLADSFSVPIDPRLGREANSTGVAPVGFVRWRSPRVGPIASFVEGGGGLLLTTDPFPPDGTAWNLTFRLGGGLELALSRHLALAIAFRHMHVSNAKGDVRENPGYNGNGVAVSLVW